jgi:RNA polymerase sigma factor (sigma-70 family)
MKEEEIDLWKQYGSGDQEALEKLLVYYMGLVRFWVSRVAPMAGWADREDLTQQGLIALVKAIGKFEPDRGYEFSTYARHWIRSALLDYLQAERSVTDYQYQNYRRVDQAQETLTRKLGRKPTMAEIAQRAELTERQVERALDALAIAMPESLAVDGAGLSVNIATIESPETLILIRELLLELDERERWIISESYDLGCTDREIATQCGLASDHVKTIRRRALKKLLKRLEAKSGDERHENR